MMTRSLNLDHDPMSNVYRLKCLKFKTMTYRLTDLLTRVKSRDASASKNDSGATALADRLDENR